MALRNAVAVASEPAAQSVAMAVLGDGGRSIDAVIAGFLAAAGVRASVLLSPAFAMVAGVGMPARCYDGRSLQPGRGVPRPRGFVDDADIPVTATVAVPRAIAMLAVLHAYGAARPMSVLARGGVKAARQAGATERAQVLSSLGGHGASLVRAGGQLGRALLREAGPAAGGLVSEVDLTTALPCDCGATLRKLEGQTTLALPAGQDDIPKRADDDVALRAVHVIAAADTRGYVAVVCYAPDEDGVSLSGLQLIAPRDALPVRRGVPRCTPGSVRPMRLPLGVLYGSSGLFAAYGVAGTVGQLAEVLPEDGSYDQIINALERTPAAFAAIVAKGRVRGIAVRS